MENNIAGIPIRDLKPLAIKYEGNDSFESIQKIALKISTAKCARISYSTHNGKIDYEKDIALHDQLLESHHMSPAEHVARCMTDEEYNSFIKGKMLVEDEGGGVRYINYLPGNKGWCNNFKGFIQYRYLIENNEK